jgi:ferredoxin
MNQRLMEGQADDPLRERRDALARTAALLALQAVPPAQAPDTVGYRSAGYTLVIGAAADALPWAERLAAALPVTALLTEGEAGPEPRAFPVFSAPAVALAGWLGAFEAHWQTPGEPDRQGRFDLVLDLGASARIGSHQKPHGYYAPGADEAARRQAADALLEMVGDFEKPRYFVYKDRLCAHSRNTRTGCSACIEVCSAQAIGAAGERIAVNPYLCAGCGACTTVCPTGALGYAFPTASHSGSRIKAALRAYLDAGGTDPVLLLHSAQEGASPLAGFDKVGRDLPGHLIPLALHHTASTGIDVWLAALAWGASGVCVLASGAEAPQYAVALEQQMAIAQAVLDGLGYAGPHFALLRAATPDELAPLLPRIPRGEAPAEPATFNLAADKRNSLDYALAHLHRHAPEQPQHIALPAGAPFGAVEVKRDSCSLCMACVGACPSSALMDGLNAPQLRFVEQNCVQCGLCVATCPEQAITLTPRLSFADARKEALVLNESQPFHCIRCNKPFGSLQMIENMLSKLSTHSAFSANLDRLRMCGDCRVIDLMSTQDEAIVQLRRR